MGRLSGPGPAERTDYPLAASVRARLMGTMILLLGLVVCVVSAGVVVLDLPSGIVSGLVLLALAVVACGGFLLTRAPWVVRADPEGYAVRFVRGAGARSARWMDVEDVVSATVHGARCVVLRLRDGRSTTVPVAVVGMGADDFVRALRGHLDRAFGYRR